MVTVPTYQQTERLRPAFQQGIDVRATPDAFGAAIGRGMKSVAAGGMQLADSIQQVEDLKATLVAKDGMTALERDQMELDYGPNGFMTKQGRDAVDGRAAYNQALEELKKKHAPTAGLAAQKYNQAATALVTDGMRTGIRHSAQGLKDWHEASSIAVIETLKQKALTGYDNPQEVQKALYRGFAEIDNQLSMMGLSGDKAVVDLKKLEFSSDIHASVALAIADGPNGARGALDYVKKNSEAIAPARRLKIEETLRPFAADEEGAAAATDFITKGRKVSDLPGDIVGEVAGVTGRAGGGPTRAKQFLSSRSTHKSRPMDTLGLDNDFAENLAAMIQDAPPGIKDGLGLFSAFRTREEQANAYANARKGMAAKPGGSQHEVGRAVDLGYNGQSLARAPADVVQWVHDNAGKYGLYFSLMNSQRAMYGLAPISESRQENWHIEPLGTRGTTLRGSTVVPARDGVSFRASAPSYSDALERANEIADPQARAAFLKHVSQQFEFRAKAESANTDAAKNQIWTMMMQNTPLSAIPLELKIAAGREAVSGFMDFEAKAGDVKTDPVAYSNLSTMAATNPDEFSKLDLTSPEIINSLSREDWKVMSNKKTSILGDERKAREEALVLTTAFSQANDQLAAVGITTTGKNGDRLEKEAKRVAQFQNELAVQMDEFKRLKGQVPNQMEIQNMINRLLLPIVVQSPRAGYNPAGWFGDDFSTSSEKFMFEGGARADGTTIDVVVEYSDIPIDLRNGLKIRLEGELGRKPSEEEIVKEYEKFVLNR